jgi:serine/threonine protein kinase
MQEGFTGTLVYLAPEVTQKKGYEKEIDWWALGILIYELLTGMPPFYDSDPKLLFKAIQEDEPDYPEIISDKAKSLI